MPFRPHPFRVLRRRRAASAAAFVDIVATTTVAAVLFSFPRNNTINCYNTTTVCLYRLFHPSVRAMSRSSRAFVRVFIRHRRHRHHRRRRRRRRRRSRPTRPVVIPSWSPLPANKYIIIIIIRMRRARYTNLSTRFVSFAVFNDLSNATALSPLQQYRVTCYNISYTDIIILLSLLSLYYCISIVISLAPLSCIGGTRSCTIRIVHVES